MRHYIKVKLSQSAFLRPLLKLMKAHMVANNKSLSKHDVRRRSKDNGKLILNNDRNYLPVGP
jgi:hypothetical protein